MSFVVMQAKVFVNSLSKKNLIDYTEVRFATNFFLSERLCDQKKYVVNLFTDVKFEKYAEKQNWRQEYAEIKAVVQRKEFWDMLEALVKVCEPILMILRLCDGDVPCCGKIYYKTFQLRCSGHFSNEIKIEHI